MRVMYALHEHAFARQQSHVWMMIPKGIAMTAPILFMPELFERRSVTLVLQEIDHATRANTVDEALNYGSFLLAISDDMKMIRHDHISEDQKPARSSGFIQSGAGDGLHLVRAKDG